MIERSLSLVSRLRFREPTRRYANPQRSMDLQQVTAEIEEHLAAAAAWRDAAGELEALRSMVPDGFKPWAPKCDVRLGEIVIRLDAQSENGGGDSE